MYPTKNLRASAKLVAAAGTAEALLASSLLCKNVRIKALKANTDNVYVGDSSVSAANGFELAPSEEVDLADFVDQGETIDLAEIYVDVVTNSDGVSFFWVE